MVDPILLASVSPRRRRLFALLGVGYDCASVDIPEELPERPDDPDAAAAGLASDKALAARRTYGRGPTIVNADTIVVHDGRVLGKPADHAGATRMLKELSGNTHQVITAAAVFPPGIARPIVETVTSSVLMRDLTPEAIRIWIGQGESLGCAGAYNIESHLASVGPAECFQNVAGLPLCHLYRLFADGQAGEPPEGLTSPVRACDQALERTCALGPRVIAGVQLR
jgi:septum formation protein